MPTELGEPYSLTWRGDPPHMLKADLPIWYRFLDKYGSPFIRVYYDVLLGGPFLTEEDRKDPLKKDWRYLTAKRMDALAELLEEIWLIEVVHVAGMRSLGQCQAYLELWLLDPKIDKPPRKVLIAETIDDDLLTAAAAMRILTFLV